MTNIFISHSKHDKDILAVFNQLFAISPLKSIMMEYELVNENPARKIQEEIDKSKALFVLLGPNIKDKDQTKMWIGFEVGIASTLKKPIWVFEQTKNPIEIPIPKVDHYVLYDPEDIEQIRKIIKKYEQEPELGALAREITNGIIPPKLSALLFPIIDFLTVDLLTQTHLNEPKPAHITCPYPQCQIQFYLHSNLKQFKCPTCKKDIHR